MPQRTPILDNRNAAGVVGELLVRLPGYVPELKGAPGGPVWAMVQVLGRYAQVLIERLNQAPDKNKLAFLDLMGINLLQAQAARAPVVFQPLPNVGDSTAPARTRVGAKIPGQNNPVVFETEQAVAVATAGLVEVRTVLPDSDAFADHTVAVTSGAPFTLFRSLHPFRHELYLAHDVFFALAGKSTVTIQFDLAAAGSQALDITWEFWNGEIWEQFGGTDATSGLTRSGAVRLATDCGRAALTTVNNVNSYWVRGVLSGPLPPVDGVQLASVNRIRVASTISRPLPAACTGNIRADQALSDGVKLDLTKTFYPLGRTPDSNSAFYFSSAEVFSKPGASVELCYRRGLTPEEEADKMAAEQLRDRALGLEGDAASKAGSMALNSATALLNLVTQPGGFLNNDPLILNFTNAIQALKSAITHVSTAQQMDTVYHKVEDTVAAMKPLISPPAMQFSGLPPAASSISSAVRDAISILESLRDLVPLLAGAHVSAVTMPALDAVNEVELLATSTGQAAVLATPPLDLGDLPVNVDLLAVAIAVYGVQQVIDPLIDPANKVADSLNTVVNNAPGVDYATMFGGLLQAASVGQSLVARLLQLAQTAGAGTVDENAPKLDPPRLVWEYWNGSRWVTLLAPSTDDVANFQATGKVAFQVPKNFEPSDVNGATARWIRVRLASGSYNQIRFVNWKDQVTNQMTSMAIIQPRPPVLEGFYFGYDFQSPLDAAERCFTFNDFAFEDNTGEAHWSGSPFEPFRPMADRTPALYLGFDRALPADLLGVYFNIEEQPDVTDGPALTWEYWDGSGWQSLSAADETRTLAIPGMVTAVWPGAASQPLARFGTARTWIRARLAADRTPLSSRVDGIHPNAVWASNLQTVENEVLGSSNGQPQQVFFYRQTPVVDGESFEVRELDGARAAVELPMLRDELIAAGLTDADIRLVTDSRTGKPTEVWVRWRVRPNLLFSGAGDRDATIERTRGRLILGDGAHGRIPPPGIDNIRTPLYRFGGGLVGNVPAGTITQLLSGVMAKGVTNPRRAEAGADGELPDRVLSRGPRVLRHRYRAVSREDYEDLAREASPGVALARALPATHPNGRPATGWVTVIIVPQSQDAKPQPSFELRRLVQAYLAARAPGSVAGIGVIGPTFLPVGVDVMVKPIDPQQAKAVADGVTAALAAFLHPLTGGPDGDGWQFGRNVFISDVAAVVEGVPGVDYASHLELLLNDTPCGDRVDVPADRIVVAGSLRVTLQGGEA